jgi:cytochrome c5
MRLPGSYGLPLGAPLLAASAALVALIACMAHATAAAAAGATADTAAATAAAPEPTSVSGSLLPEDPSRAVVIRTCGVCHPLELVVAQRRTQDQWDELIGRMMDRGAQASDQEQLQILEYLLKYFGRADSATPQPPPPAGE